MDLTTFEIFINMVKFETGDLQTVIVSKHSWYVI